MEKKNNKVLLIGWDGADWKIINRLVDEGKMPVLKNMIEQGVMGNITTLQPAYSPMLWTTIATGKYPDKHGVLGFIEPLPDLSGIRPVSSSSRKVKALWNILMQRGYKTHVFNWWPSHPAEPVNGIYVSNLFPKANTTDYLNWQVPDDAVHPPELKDLMAHFRVHPLELSQEHIAQFIPALKEFTPKVMKKVEAIARNIAEASTVQAVATLAMEQEPWDFTAIYWDTIDHFCHGFMNYMPPQLKGVNSVDYELFSEVVDNAYRLMDLMLGNLLQHIDENCNVILLSDHGFKSGNLRSPYTPNEPAGPAHHHRNVGVFCAKGPGIRKDEIVYGASLLDITPTILTIMGLPIGEDMDGKPLVDIFEKPPIIETITSWENIDGDCGMLPDEKRDLDSTYSTEAIKQLIELGYIDEPDEDAKKSAENVADEIKYNLAQVYYNTNRRHLAKPLLTELFDKYPHRGRYFFKLNECLLDEGNIKQCRDLIKVFKTSAEKKVLSQVQINHLKTRKPPEILNKKEKAQWLKKVISDPIGESKQAINDLFNLNFTEGNLLIHEGQMRKAIRKYRETEKLAPKKNAFFSKMGNAFLRLSQWRDAEEMFRKVLANYEEDENANLGLGISLFHQKKYQESLDVLLDAVYLNFYSAKNHYYIGATLSELKRFDEAAQSFEIALKINPNFGVCRNRLIVLYDESLGNSEKAKNLRITETSIENSNGQSIDIATDVLIRPKADRLSQTPIIVVSGLPRSGTSMMMQLLDAAGVPIYTDEKRKPDNSNPQGYFEHDKVKQLIRNNAWMEEATGKAVKIVVPLLYKIPAAFTYKVIFMERNLDEIIESQHQMLIESSKMKNDTYAVQIENSFKKQLHEFEAWKKRNPNAEVLNINYNEAIDKKAETVSKVFGFLNIDANQETLANIIDKNLYRTKKN